MLTGKDWSVFLIQSVFIDLDKNDDRIQKFSIALKINMNILMMNLININMQKLLIKLVSPNCNLGKNFINVAKR